MTTTPAAYRIVFTASASREVNKLDASMRLRILARIHALSRDPRPPGALKLTGRESYRVRVSDYRIVYTVEDDVLVVTVIRVAHRREVYR
jgi:mRNA interferase RelE/StbE